MNRHWMEREHNAILQTYKRLPIVVEKAEGCQIYDKNGECYLDMLAGIAVNALGHGHPKIIEAVSKQIERYMHISNYFYQDIQILLAEELLRVSGFDRVFFSNSGTESVEGALKLVRRWGNQNNRTQIIAFSGGFHGRTFGALSMMDKPHYKDGMGPFLDGMTIAEYNNIEDLKAKVDSNTAAVIIEFIQGEGGLRSLTPEFATALQELRKEYGFLIIADEIQSGIGRTGKFFAYEHYSIKPDIITSAKGVGGGLPLGVLLVSEKLAGIFEKGMHGTTYGGNSAACAAGLVVIRELDNGLLQNVIKMGKYLKSRLEELHTDFPEYILEIRGMGLMVGVHLSFDAAEAVTALLEKRVIANSASGTVLRLVPPLIIGSEEIDEFILKFKQLLSERVD